MNRRNNERLFEEAARLAPKHRTLAGVAMAVNEATGVNMTPAAWRALFIRNPDQRERVRSSLAAAASTGAVLSDNERIAIVSDAHAPYHDERAIEAACAAIRDFQPTALIMNGDMVDFYALSRFDKDPERALRLQYELDMAFSEVLTPLCEAAGDARKFYVKGNHEDRLNRYLNAHPEIASLRALRLASLLHFEDLGIEYVDRDVEVNGNVLVTHGQVVRKWAGRSVQGEMERMRFGISIVMGHVHRTAKVATTTRSGPIWGIEAGCLCSLDPDYMYAPDWQHGMALVESTPAGASGRLVELH